MLSSQAPALSVGLPVYNGERFLAEALDSLLAQTFEDFELIISDNASTDSTAAICRAYAAKDARVRYERNPVNLGARANLNRVFHRARGRYFRWAAHDDVCAPTFAQRCIEVLEQDPLTVLAFPRYVRIDAEGNTGEHQPWTMDLVAPRPHQRLAALLARGLGHPAIFGVIRSHVLAKTGLHADYWGTDRAILAELCLYGRIRQVPEELFYWRTHPGQFWFAKDKVGVYNARAVRKVEIMHLKHARNYARILTRTPLGAKERALCCAALGRALLLRSGEFSRVLADESFAAARQLWARRARRRAPGADTQHPPGAAGDTVTVRQ